MPSLFRSFSCFRLLLLFAVLFVPVAARAEWVSIPGPGGVSLRANLLKPGGSGPHPAVIALHGCSGLGGSGMSNRHADWGERLRDAGFLVVFPDSFGSRGLGSQCLIKDRDREIDQADRKQDVFAVAEWLAARPDVNKRKIGLLGWSNGAMATLHATNGGSGPKGVDFRQAIAFYPGCKVILRKGYSPRVPVTILHGLADNWTAAEPCRQLPGVRFVGYEGAYHNFDAPGQKLRTRKAANSADGSGTVTIGTDEKARADSIRRVMGIFGGM